MKTRKRVILEPELEALAGELGAFDRLMMARKLARWAQQLRVSARMLSQPASKRQRLPRLTDKQAKLN